MSRHTRRNRRNAQPVDAEIAFAVFLVLWLLIATGFALFCAATGNLPI